MNNFGTHYFLVAFVIFFVVVIFLILDTYFIFKIAKSQKAKKFQIIINTIMSCLIITTVILNSNFSPSLLSAFLSVMAFYYLYLAYNRNKKYKILKNKEKEK